MIPVAQTLRTNLHLNPSFRATGGTVTVRTNLSTSSRNPLGWSVSQGPGGTLTAPVAVASGAPDGGAFLRITCTTSNTGVGGGFLYGSQTGNYLPVTPGTVYVHQVAVRPSVTKVVYMLVRYYDTNNAQVGDNSHAAASVSCPGGAWTTFVTPPAAAPANAVRAFVSIYNTGSASTPFLAGETFDVASHCIEAGAAALPPFDGATPAGFDLNLTAAWTGTANASTSVATGPRLVDWTYLLPYTAVWQAEDGASAYSRVVSSGGASTTTSLLYSALSAPISGGQQASASLRSLGSTPVRVRIFPYQGGSQLPVSGYSAPAADGGVTSVDGFVPDPSANGFRLIVNSSGNLPAGATVRVGQALLEVAPSAGFYFDGDTAGTDSWRTAWTGTPQRSSSILTDVGGLTVNGVDLQTLAWNIKNRSSRWAIAGRRGSNRDLPGLHGTSKLTGKPYDEGTVVLTMWALGCNHDGTMPSGSRARRVEEHIDRIGRLFSAPTLTLVQPRGDGDRVLTGEVVKAIDFTSMAGGTRAEFAVEIVAADPFWHSQGVVSQTVVTAAAGTYVLSSFADCTAPIVGATYTVTGPVNSPVLTDPVTGQWVKLAANVPAGQSWVVDSSQWTSKLNGGNALAQTSHGGGATFIDLSADEAGPRITLGGTGQTSATSVRIEARKAYLSA